MKVLLKENIEDLGKKGDILEVSPGYGRNFLIPKKLAMEVTPTNGKMIEMVQRALRKGLEKEMKSFQSLVQKLNQVTLAFPRKAGTKDTIFGSVSATDIKEALADLDFSIEKRRILLSEPLKRLGSYAIPIKVFHDERAEITVEVIKEGEAGPPEEAEGLETLSAGKPDPEAEEEEKEPESAPSEANREKITESSTPEPGPVQRMPPEEEK